MTKHAEPDLSAWPERHQAAELLGISRATMDRWIHDGKVQTAYRPRNGHKPAIVVNPADVERLKPPVVSTPAFVEKFSALGAQLAPHQQVAAISEWSASLAEKLARLSAIYGGKTEKLLTIKQAAQQTGLTQAYLRYLIESGELPVIRDGRRTRIRPRDLRAL
jgi:excisionase family DNA binding protein